MRNIFLLDKYRHLKISDYLGSQGIICNVWLSLLMLCNWYIKNLDIENRCLRTKTMKQRYQSIKEMIVQEKILYYFDNIYTTLQQIRDPLLEFKITTISKTLSTHCIRQEFLAGMLYWP